MASHSDDGQRRIVVDNIHGDIALTAAEWRVVNTASFQRLRSLKQLGMGHLVYPNATHTRFAHSLGVFAIMCRIVSILKEGAHKLKPRDFENLRLAALLHDIGHYPYSHLMERVDNVQLTEEELVEKKGKQILSANVENYPDHETLGRHILENQADIRTAIGGMDRAREIGALFARLESTDPQLSKLIHSSLDMDRLDYLLRDSRASGVPYGVIDLNYLLNNIRISPKGVLGVQYKALAAAEHFLLARLFMHRVVYYHKTTFGFEEACRQLLRRIRDRRTYGIAADGKAILQMSTGPKLMLFTDDYVDRIIREATADSDPAIHALANCIASRTPPKLLAEVSGLQKRGDDFHAGKFFRERCKADLPALAKKHGLPLGVFLLCGPKPIKIEERGPLLTREEARKLQPEEREELIKVFEPGCDEPKSIVEVDRSLIKHLADHPYGIHRLYVVDETKGAVKRLAAMKKAVEKWTRPD